MVAGLVSQPRIVEQRPTRRLVENDVGRIRDELGEIRADRVRIGSSGAVCVSGHGGPVRIAGLMHEGGAADSATVDVDQRVDLARFRIAADKGGGAVQAIFLAFVEQQGHRPGRRCSFQERSNLDQGRDADPVVSGTRTRRRAVVMGVEQNRPARRRSKQRDDVVHPGAGDSPLLIQFVAGKLVANDRFDAHALER